MNLQSVVDEMKGRVESLSSQSQKAAKLSIDTFKQANEIVVDSVQSLIKGQSDAAKDLLASAKSGFEKARVDGVKAVISAPTSYLPPREKLADALTESRKLVVKTSDDLVKLMKDGYASFNSDVDAAAAEVKKTVRKARSSAAKATSKATKSVKAAAK